MPTFYDKLLQVPILNLSVRLSIARRARSVLAALDPGAARPVARAAPAQPGVHVGLGGRLRGHERDAGGVGDRHPGQWVPFWQQACGARTAARLRVSGRAWSRLTADAGSGWACNEVGIRRHPHAPSGQTQAESDRARATASFERGCRLGFVPACRNATRPTSDTRAFEQAPPALADYAIVLRGSKGPIADRSGPALLARACEQGWPDTCGRTSP